MVVLLSAKPERSLGAHRAGPKPLSERRLPLLAERSDLYIERPRRARLVRHAKDLLGDVRRLDEELVGLVGLEAVACPGHVDHGVDVEVRDVHTPRAEIARACTVAGDAGDTRCVEAQELS